MTMNRPKYYNIAIATPGIKKNVSSLKARDIIILTILALIIIGIGYLKLTGRA